MAGLDDFVNNRLGSPIHRGLQSVTVSLRLPRYQVEQLDYVAHHLNCSRQVLLAQLVDSGITEVVELVCDSLAEEQGGKAADDFVNGFTEFEYLAEHA